MTLFHDPSLSRLKNEMMKENKKTVDLVKWSEKAWSYADNVILDQKEVKEGLLRELNWWYSLKDTSTAIKKNGYQIITNYIFTDASSSTWGIESDGLKLSGTFTDEDTNIYRKEAKAVSTAVYQYVQKINEKSLKNIKYREAHQLVFLVDNQSLICSFNRKRARDIVVHNMIKNWYSLSLKYKFDMVLTQVSTKNMKADAASRLDWSREEMSVSTKALSKIWSILHCWPKVDCYASKTNILKCPEKLYYYSKVKEPEGNKFNLGSNFLMVDFDMLRMGLKL